MKKIFSKMDRPLLIAMIIFLVFGLIMIQSASSMESFMRYNYSPYHYFVRELLFIIIGLFGFLITILFPTKSYKKIDKFLLAVIIFSLVGLLFYGHAANNAASWYKFGPITIQPSEFAKLVTIIYLSCYYEKNRDKLNNNFNIIIPIVPIIIIAGLIFIQPDMGTAIIIAIITLFLFYGAPINKKNRSIYTKFLIVLTTLAILIFITTGGSFLKDYQLERFNFTKPCERYQEDSGYQLCNSFIAFKNGGIKGQGLGGSTQKYLYLPESYTDFIFPIIVEECGLFVGIIIIIMYMFVLYRIIRVARKSPTLRGSLLCYGVFAYLVSHIFVNLFGVTGLIPLTGVPLPFLSYGGSYAISLLLAIGIVERVAIETNKQKLEQNK